MARCSSGVVNPALIASVHACIPKVLYHVELARTFATSFKYNQINAKMERIQKEIDRRDKIGQRWMKGAVFPALSLVLLA
jgi:hypothetical protein